MGKLGSGGGFELDPRFTIRHW